MLALATYHYGVPATVLEYGNYPWAWRMSARDVDEVYAMFEIHQTDAPPTPPLTEDDRTEDPT